MSYVLVIDQDKQPCPPVHPGQARRLLTRGKAKGPSRVQGFATGDLVKAIVPAHLKSKGKHSGRVLVRTRGVFDMRTRHGRITDIPARYCTLLQAGDGYRYAQGEAFPPHG